MSHLRTPSTANALPVHWIADLMARVAFPKPHAKAKLAEDLLKTSQSFEKHETRQAFFKMALHLQKGEEADLRSQLKILNSLRQKKVEYEIN